MKWGTRFALVVNVALVANAAWRHEWELAVAWFVALLVMSVNIVHEVAEARRAPEEESLPSALLLEKRVQTLEGQRVRLVGDVQTPPVTVMTMSEGAEVAMQRFTREDGRDVCGRMPSEGSPWVQEHCDREPGHPGRHSWEPCAEVDPSGEWMCAFSGGHEGRHSWVDGRAGVSSD